MGYHDDGCVWLKTECIHESYKCSECPVADIWCGDMDDCLEAVRKSAYRQGQLDTVNKGKEYANNFFNEMKRMAMKYIEKDGSLADRVVALSDCYTMFVQVFDRLMEGVNE